MLSGKLLAQQLAKFKESPVCQNARVQVKLPTGEFRSLMECLTLKESMLWRIILLVQEKLIG